jgi:hypothetical protein
MNIYFKICGCLANNYFTTESCKIHDIIEKTKYDVEFVTVSNRAGKGDWQNYLKAATPDTTYETEFTKLYEKYYP